jgi:acyl-CoA synthetase (AMP-forming)/AMP-acid ligase II
MAAPHRSWPITLTEVLSRATALHPDQPALIERGGDRLTTLTFAELSAAVGALSAELRSRGVGRGEVVAVWLPNWSEAVVWEFALAALGSAVLGVNTRYGVHELAHLLERARPTGVVAPARFLDLDFADRLHRARAAAGDAPPPWVAITRADADTDVGEFELGNGTWTPLRGPPVAAGLDQISAAGRPGDPVNYFTTSGSTGLPKLAGHDQSSIATHCINVAGALDMRTGDVFLGALPLSGVFGFNPAMAMLSVGGACLLEPVFDPGLVVADMEATGVTHVVGGDDMLGRVMDAWHRLQEGGRPALRGLRRGGIADFAGRVGAVVEWAQNDVGAAFSGVYGSSELFALTSIWPASLELPQRGQGGGVMVSEGISVRAVDPQSGSVCPPDTTGELQFRGYNVVCGYLGDPDAGCDAFTGDGWFRSGDLGSVGDDRASFVYVCRAGDALRLRGFLVEPAEIERFLCTHPRVSAAKVVGVPSAEDGDVAVAFVQVEPGGAVTGEELIRFCRRQLAPFKVPAVVNLIDEFPVTTGTNGTKIRSGELRRRAQNQLAERTQDGC